MFFYKGLKSSLHWGFFCRPMWNRTVSDQCLVREKVGHLPLQGSLWAGWACLEACCWCQVLKGHSDSSEGLRGNCGTDTPPKKSYLRRLMLVMVNMGMFLVSKTAYVLLKFHIWDSGFHWKFAGYQKYRILHYQLWAPDSSLKILMSSFHKLNLLHMAASCALLFKFTACLNIPSLETFSLV